jgi:hypothetical protein
VTVDSKEVRLEFERQTKNTYRYQEVGDGPQAVGVLYIQKWAVGNPPPKALVVRIEAGS